MDRILRFINGNEEIKKVIPMYIEAFVKFYGEECREEIEEKFNSLLCLGYQTPESIKRGIDQYEQKQTEKLVEPIFEKTNIPIKKLIEGKSFKYRNIMPIDYLYKLMDLYSLGEEERKQKAYEDGYDSVNCIVHMSKEEYDELYKTKQIPERLNNLPEWAKNNILYAIDDNRSKREYDRAYKNAEDLLKEIIPNITEDNYDELLDNDKIKELLSIRDEFEKANQDYKKITDELAPYYEEIEEIEKTRQETEEKLYREFLKENIDLFPENQKSQIEDYISGKQTYLDYELKKLIGTKEIANSNIDSFSEEAENILNDSNSSSWRIHDIQEERIKFFKIMGLDLGNNYEDYINNPEAKKLITSKERIEKLTESRNNYKNKFNNMFYTSQRRHKQLLKEVEERNYVDKDTPINANLYTDNCGFVAFISPNYVKTENGYKTSSMLAVNFSNFDNEYLDHTIVHELNHVMETSLALANDKAYEFYCGWDILSEEVSTVQSDEVDTITIKDKRKYELFNEIINELIAQEISKIMHEENMYVLDDKDNSKYKGGTGYDASAFLVREFFDEFREAILNSRRNGNIQAIFDEVGKENFDALNDLFTIYNENFAGLKVYSLYSALHKGEDTPATRKYYELCDKRDEILEKMIKHRDMKKQEIKGEIK